MDESNQPWASCKLRVSGDAKGNSICSPMQLLDSMSDSFRQIEDYVKMDDGQDKKYLRSSFDSVAFKDRLQDFDSKYVNQGRFGFDSLEPPGVSGHTDQAIGQQIRLPRYPLRQYGIEAGALQASRRALDRCPERRPSQESGVSTSSSSELDDTERDEASEASIVRKDSPASDELRTATKPDNLNPRKRRHEEGWSCSQPATPDFPASLASSHVHDSKPAPSMSCPLLDMFLPAGAIPTEDQLLVMSSKGGPNPLMFTGKDKSFIQIAQILVDQIISQPEILFEYPPNTMMDLQLRRINVEAGFDDPLPQILSCLFTKLECCNLKGYTALARLGPENQLHGNSPARQAPKRPSMVQSSRGLTTSQKSVYKLEAPFTCVRRAGLLVEVCSSALKFWEELGLAPASDPKDIAAFCIYPAQEYVQDGVDAFLSMMGNAYQSCKLGTHIQGSLLPEYQRGLVPVDITSHAITDVLEAIKKTCEKLGKKLPGEALTSFPG